MKKNLILAILLALAVVGFYKSTQSKTIGITAQAEKRLWTCSMHPQVIQDHPGQCPICHMELVPLEKDKTISGVVSIAPEVIQNMGIRTYVANKGHINRFIRMYGYLDEAQPNIHDINLRVSGWISKLYANSEGMHLDKGAPLFDLYSPELRIAAGELIAAKRTNSQLLDATTTKLELLGLDRDYIEQISKLQKAPDIFTFRSPISGHLIQKPVVEGSAVKSGEMALRIVDHSILWVDAQAFESDLPYLKVGEKAYATVPATPGQEYPGEILIIHPHVDMSNRTASVRFVINNPELILKPGMAATVKLSTTSEKEVIIIPKAAILDSGDSQLVFLALGDGRFEPRKVIVGAAGADGTSEIIDGLKEGEKVVINGQFLIDSESHIQEAARKFMQPDNN